jgi:hypothetical protein
VSGAAVAARAAAARAARMAYVGEEVMVEICATDAEAEAASAAAAAAAGGSGAAVAAAPAAAGAHERKSRRARRGRAPLAVDGATTLAALRLRLLEALGVHPRNARLFLRGARLDAEDSATLAELGIFPGDELRIVDTGEHDANDVEGLFAPGGAASGAAGGGGKWREAERGFAGTALTGGAPGGGGGGAPAGA